MSDKASQPVGPTRGWVVLLAGLILLCMFVRLHKLLLEAGWRHHFIGFTAGVLSVTVIKRVLNRILQGQFRREDSKIYSLKHGVLNINVTETPMWMNMGYWRDQSKPRDLPRACQSLLQEILLTAGLSRNGAENSNHDAELGSSSCSTVNIVDVGFGCGDQAIALQKLCDLGSYVGLTIDNRQYAYAEQRLKACGFLSDISDSSTKEHDERTVVRRIFHADAGAPDSWSKELNAAVTAVHHHAESSPNETNWVLGLDILYHLSPSRLPLFQHACRDLNASIMAFDLLLPDPQQRRLTNAQKLLLRLVASSTSTPYSNFLTPAQYRAHLVSAGYSEDEIEIRDISESVFGPLVDFMTWQDGQLKTLGLGIGAFHAARWVFGWWARTGIVRGCIIVARAKKQ